VFYNCTQADTACRQTAAAVWLLTNHGRPASTHDSVRTMVSTTTKHLHTVRCIMCDWSGRSCIIIGYR